MAMAIALMALAACRPATPVEGLPRGTLSIEGNSGPVQVDVSIAETRETKARGLMGVEEMDPDTGMVFLQDEPARISFWMKDTPIPLSIAFLDSGGRIVAVLDMEPCLADPCRLYDPGVPYRAALEVNRGAIARLGVEVGDVVRLDR